VTRPLRALQPVRQALPVTPVARNNPGSPVTYSHTVNRHTLRAAIWRLLRHFVSRNDKFFANLLSQCKTLTHAQMPATVVIVS